MTLSPHHVGLTPHSVRGVETILENGAHKTLNFWGDWTLQEIALGKWRLPSLQMLDHQFTKIDPEAKALFCSPRIVVMSLRHQEPSSCLPVPINMAALFKPSHVPLDWIRPSFQENMATYCEIHTVRWSPKKASLFSSPGGLSTFLLRRLL